MCFVAVTRTPPTRVNVFCCCKLDFFLDEVEKPESPRIAFCGRDKSHFEFKTCWRQGWLLGWNWEYWRCIFSSGRDEAYCMWQPFWCKIKYLTRLNPVLEILKAWTCHAQNWTEVQNWLRNRWHCNWKSGFCPCDRWVVARHILCVPDLLTSKFRQYRPRSFLCGLCRSVSRIITQWLISGCTRQWRHTSCAKIVDVRHWFQDPVPAISEWRDEKQSRA